MRLRTLLLLALFLAAPLPHAQELPAVDVSLSTPASVVENRGWVLKVTVRIPEGHVVAAETRGAIKGAWLQPDAPSYFERQYPTFPEAREMSLPGADGPVLVYTGTVDIRVPLDQYNPPRSPATIGVVFGYQLCNASRCAPFRVAPARQAIAAAEPRSLDQRLAFRVDSSRVAILTGAESRYDDSLDYQASSMEVKFAHKFAELPPGHLARPMFTGDSATGLPWTLATSRSSLSVTPDRPGAFYGGCPDSNPLALVAGVGEAAFGASREKYLVASRGTALLPPGRARVLVRPATLSEVRMQELRALVQRQLRSTMPTVFAPDQRPYAGGADVPVRDYDRRILRGEGRLVLHIESFRLAPDDADRLYVRAFWAINGAALTGMTLWVRVDRDRFVVEQTDASVTRFGRFSEMVGEHGSNVAEQPDYAGILLNVIPAADGWAYILIGRRGYESFGVELLKYSPNGPLATGALYGYGC